ncbi:MAG: ketoacyl-ACP synthase III, partial [Myxococcota bacterium]|nr:ketoacyl-ACP synthase III [Myxococcota bacterium]
MSIPVKIIATGHYIPKRAVYSVDLDTKFGFDLGYIERRNGVVKRHVAEQKEGETTSMMGVWATEAALNQAGYTADMLDLIIFASAGPEQGLPDTAPLIQAKLGLGSSGIACFSV